MPDLAEWLPTPLGRYLVEREQAYYDREVADIFGYNALQLGLPQQDLLRNNRMPLHLHAGREEKLELRTDPAFLPLGGQSIDLVLLPHVLEFSDQPHQILREVERVLIPEGQLIVSGFNPFSLWGMARRLPGVHDTLPGRRRFISLPRIKDWLALLGFEVTAGRMCCYAPPIQRETWLRRFSFMETAGDRWWALGGGIYFLRARKRVQGMRLIMPTWHELRAAKKALKPATQKLLNRNDPQA